MVDGKLDFDMFDLKSYSDYFLIKLSGMTLILFHQAFLVPTHFVASDHD